jgi:GNAT superfamily N-acetyltransferase
LQNVITSVATECDIPELSALLALLFEQEAEFEPDPAVQRRGLHDIIVNPGVGKILVAHLDGQAVGMVSLLFSVSTALGGRVAWLEDMVVQPNWRNSGIGSVLLTEALALCRAEDCRRVTLLTDADNHAAQAFYRKHGFSGSAMLPMRCFLRSE